MESDHFAHTNATHVKHQSTTKAKQHLLTIPPELRLLIYEACFSTYHFKDTDPQPGILFTCKFIHKEALKPYEACIMTLQDGNRTKHEEANTVLQRKLDTCTYPIERLLLQADQMNVDLKHDSINTDLEIELAKVHRMMFGSWFKKPRRKDPMVCASTLDLWQPPFDSEQSSSHQDKLAPGSLKAPDHYTHLTMGATWPSRPVLAISRSNEKNKTAPRCHLLELPAEVRLIIYDHHLATFGLDTTRVTPQSDMQPALLHTCRLIRKEALDVYEARLIETAREQHQKITQSIEHFGRLLVDPSRSRASLRDTNIINSIARLEMGMQRVQDAHELEISGVRRVRVEEFE